MDLAKYCVDAVLEEGRSVRAVAKTTGREYDNLPSSNTTSCQSTQCREAPSFTGRWHFSARNGTWWRGWSCEVHIDGLTAVREFGRSRR